jgi:hypothetical protein
MFVTNRRVSVCVCLCVCARAYVLLRFLLLLLPAKHKYIFLHGTFRRLGSTSIYSLLFLVCFYYRVMRMCDFKNSPTPSLCFHLSDDLVVIFLCFKICFLGNSTKKTEIKLQISFLYKQYKFPHWKREAKKPNWLVKSCSFSSLNHMQSVKFRFEANFPSLSPLQLVVYKWKERNIVVVLVLHRRLMPNCCRHQNTVTTVLSSTKSGN